MNYEVRKATLADREAIARLIAESARGLSREHYDDAQIEAALASIFGVDTDLIDDGTYYVAEQDGTLIGCGGWSRRKKLYGGDHFPIHDAGMLDPANEPARIRSFFVHPDHARKGVARVMLSLCESEAKAHGFAALELMATLPGIKFYEANGYSPTGDFDLDLADGVKIQFVPMRKEL
ncbi:MAG TPA: GNAT family N-acetyltransferase [Pyrinomonadaceae bacterium]|jgi:GNAT superfamily N-acetyltransferase|nr:GNAT family N-acetyltransferase [Pyrinomonadaceae bacterium]